MSIANRNRMLANMKARRNAQNAAEMARMLARAPAAPTHRPRAVTYANFPSVPTHKAAPKAAPGRGESMNSKMKRWQAVLQQRRKEQEARRRAVEERIKAYAALTRRLRSSRRR